MKVASGWLRIFLCGTVFASVLWGVPVSASASLSIPFTVNLSEPVVVSGTPRIALDVGGVSRFADYASGSGTSTLTFTYTAQAGDLDLDGVTVSSPIQLNGGTIKDVAGNNTTLTFSPPNTSGIKINYPSLAMDFSVNDYILNGAHSASLTGFLSAAGGTFTRASVGTFYDSAGVLQTASSDVPRFDYDPVTHVAKGLLIEASRTNYLLYSGLLSNGNWVALYASKVTGQSAPDGSTGAIKLVEDTSTNAHHVKQTYTVADNTVVTVSAFAKAGERTLFVLQGKKNDGVTYPNAVFNLSTGVLVSSINLVTGGASISPVGNGWYRCSITYNSGTGGGGGIVFMTTHNGASGSYTGNGVSGLYVWGGQLEISAPVTSYIPTTTAAVTRATDVLSVPLGAWYNASSGTVFANYMLPQLGSSGYPGVVVLGDGSYNNGILLYISDAYDDSKRGQIKSGGSISFDHTVGAIISVNTQARAALAYAADNSNIANNGTVATTDSSVVIPSGLTVLNLGGGNNAITSPLNGYLKSFSYYPARVSDSQLGLLSQ